MRILKYYAVLSYIICLVCNFLIKDYHFIFGGIIFIILYAPLLIMITRPGQVLEPIPVTFFTVAGTMGIGELLRLIFIPDKINGDALPAILTVAALAICVIYLVRLYKDPENRRLLKAEFCKKNKNLEK